MATAKSGHMDSGAKRRGKGGLWKGVSKWWKRRNFYLSHEENDGPLNTTVSEEEERDPAYLHFLDMLVISQTTSNASTVDASNIPDHNGNRRSWKSHPMTTEAVLDSMKNRSRPIEHETGSLESLDSLASSRPDEEPSSQSFFQQHVNFLRVQTQPRQVQVVWDVQK